MSEFQIGSIVRVQSGIFKKRVGVIINKAAATANLGWYVLLEDGTKVWTSPQVAKKCEYLGLLAPGCIFRGKGSEDGRVVITEVNFRERWVSYKGSSVLGRLEILEAGMPIFLRTYIPDQKIEEDQTTMDSIKFSSFSEDVHQFYKRLAKAAEPKVKYYVIPAKYAVALDTLEMAQTAADISSDSEIVIIESTCLFTPQTNWKREE